MIYSNKLVILTGNDDFFGQTRRPWVSMHVPRMMEFLANTGFDVSKYAMHEVINQIDCIKQSIVFYSFNQKLNRRNYLLDLIYMLNKSDNILIPSFDLLKCHENKGFQELYKKRIGLKSLDAVYLSSYKEIPLYPIRYPAVLKSVDGSNGKGVYLVHNEAELVKKIKKLEHIPLTLKLDLMRRRYLRKHKKFKEYPEFSARKDYEEYSDYIIREKNFIVQEFVPDLTFDYRVLILFDQYYVSKRHTRSNDFRASGAKKFDFNFKVDEKLLNYAREVYQKFDTPFLSIDVVPKDGDYFMLEFQASHFGLNVFVKNDTYFKYINGRWENYSFKPEIEKEVTGALSRYLMNRYKIAGLNS